IRDSHLVPIEIRHANGRHPIVGWRPFHLVARALNIVSKMLCFVAAILLFVWRDAERPIPRPQ
ncbi:MAG: hypothetical protein WBW45_18020, partial [Bradyrhizobium sp.]